MLSPLARVLGLWLAFACLSPAIGGEATGGTGGGGEGGVEDAGAQLAQGKSLYKQMCAHCHGIDMVSPGTGSFDLRTFPIEEHERFRSSVTKGVGSMPAWGDILTPDEVAALWSYVATRGGREPMPPAADEPGTEESFVPDLLHEGTLTVCMARNGAAMSSMRHEGGVGFDYEVTRLVAKTLGLTLDPIWYEAELDEESDPVRETYALLSAGLCDVVPGFALYEPALSEPPADRARLPRTMDLAPGETPPFVDLEPIVAVAPYARVEMGIVLGEAVADRRIDDLADLRGLTLGIEEGTLAGALVLSQAPRELVKGSVSMPPGPHFLWRLENGEFDAAMISLPAFDFHRRQNPITTLRLSNWRHPFGMNIGFAVLARHSALASALDAALSEHLADGAVAAAARTAEVTVAPPAEPRVTPAWSLSTLLRAH